MNTTTTERSDIAMTERGRLIYLDDNGDREFSPRTQTVIRYLSVAFLSVVAMLAILIATGLMPPAPWSPMGRVEQINNEPQIELPDEWHEPAPVDPDQSVMDWPEPGTNV